SAAHECLTRVDITPPPVTNTADDKHWKAGKPAPDPFLNASALTRRNVHERSKIENCGAYFVVDNMEQVRCELVNGQPMFTILS
ncbi:hypothetical protein C8R42DRAFT_585443, partial [Lentinula raphanica]